MHNLSMSTHMPPLVPTKEVSEHETLLEIWQDVTESFPVLEHMLDEFFKKADEIAEQPGRDYRRQELKTIDAQYRAQMKEALVREDTSEEPAVFSADLNVEDMSVEQMRQFLRDLEEYVSTSSERVTAICRVQEVAFKDLQQSLTNGREGATYRVGNGVIDGSLLKDQKEQENLQNRRNTIIEATRALRSGIELADMRLDSLEF